MGEEEVLSGKQISELKSDIRDIRHSLEKIAETITRLAVLETENKQLARTVEDLRTRQAALEKKLQELETAIVKASSQVSGAMGTVKVIWTAIGAIVIGIAMKIYNK